MPVAVVAHFDATTVLFMEALWGDRKIGEVKGMTKEMWIAKMTSRKLWLAVALFVSGLITAFGGEGEVAETVSGCIMQAASVVGYLLAEGLTDAAYKE